LDPRFAQRPLQLNRNPYAGRRVLPGAMGASVVGAVAAGFHGYMRNRSWGWAAAWALGGLTCPAVTLAFAISQGYGRRK